MIVLDTNVMSEPLRARPDSAVLDWLDKAQPEALYSTAVNVAEIFSGLALMPAGRRRTKLKQVLVEQVMPLFAGRILSFDESAAQAFARVVADARAVGNTMSFADAAIAAIASVHGFVLATRNVRDFNGTKIEVLNPWDQSRSPA
jgi:predicted nucleic acid-binding protein